MVFEAVPSFLLLRERAGCAAMMGLCVGDFIPADKNRGEKEGGRL